MAEKQARKCDDFTDLMDVDIRRDKFLSLLSQRQFKRAESQLDLVAIPDGIDASPGDIVERRGAAKMADGRLRLHQGQTANAKCLFTQAGDLLVSHRQWRHNNASHWLLAAVIEKDSDDIKYCASILKDDPRRSRRLEASILRVTRSRLIAANFILRFFA